MASNQGGRLFKFDIQQKKGALMYKLCIPKTSEKTTMAKKKSSCGWHSSLAKYTNMIDKRQYEE